MTRERASVGILGIGVFLPEEIRSNDWWPDDVVRRWSARPRPPPPDLETLTPGARRVAEASAALRDDPFQGFEERRVMAEGMSVSEMETRAARDALEAADLAPAVIDLVLTHSAVPDHLGTNVACSLHRALGLPERCFALGVEGAANSFLLQLSLAERMIAGGAARYALLVQSAGFSRIMRYDEFYSPWFGDGATAVVVGPVGVGQGVLGAAHVTDGRFDNVLVAGNPGGRWHDEGPVTLWCTDEARAQEMFLESADTAKNQIEAALAEASLSPGDVDFFACHQGTAWLRPVVQEHAGLVGAQSLDTYARTASLFAANVPFVLWQAVREGGLRGGDVVAMLSAGNGITCSSVVLRWGSS